MERVPGRRGVIPRHGSDASNIRRSDRHSVYNDPMSDADHVRGVLDALARQPAERKPFVLSVQYLRDVARVEALPENRDGADKTWVLKLTEEMVRLQRNAVRTR